MNENQLSKAWLFTDIEGVRDMEGWGTYFLFNYDELPPIQIELDDEFNWLKPYPEWEDEIERNYDFNDKLIALNKEAESKGLIIPESFNNFMNSVELISRIRSNTDCYFELGDFIEEIPNMNGLHLIHFLSDSQYCGFWHLCLGKNGNQSVVASRNLFGRIGDEYQNYRNEDDEIGYYCAKDFKEFIFRFWIENEIWLKRFYRQDDLNKLEKEYIIYYQKENKE